MRKFNFSSRITSVFEKMGISYEDIKNLMLDLYSNELGEGVTQFRIGQRVSGEGHITCGHCRNCHNGDIQWCKDTFGVGVDRNGAFAEYLCIPASNVITIDENLDEDVVAFFDAFGNEDKDASRRVVFKFRMTDEQMIQQMRQILEAE